MKVHENRYEETYGGLLNYRMDVTDFGKNMHISQDENLNICISERKPGFVCHKTYTIISASENEIANLKRNAIQNMETKIQEINEHIENVIEKHPVCLKTIRVNFHKEIKENLQWMTKSPCKGGIVSIETTLLDLIRNGFIHPNTEYSKYFGYYVLYGGFHIVDKEVDQFTKKMIKHFYNDTSDLKWIRDSYREREAYKTLLYWSKNVDVRSIGFNE